MCSGCGACRGHSERKTDFTVSQTASSFTENPSAKALVACRDHPEKTIDFTVSRNGGIVHIPVTPSLSADGTGRIGVSLAVNAKIVRKAAKGPGDALRLASAEFGRLTGIVVGGVSRALIRPVGKA